MRDGWCPAHIYDPRGVFPGQGRMSDSRRADLAKHYYTDVRGEYLCCSLLVMEGDIYVQPLGRGGKWYYAAEE